MAKKTRFVAAYALLIVVLLTVFVIYKLVETNWFAGVSTPTLLVYSLVFVAFIAALWQVIEGFLKSKAESKK